MKTVRFGFLATLVPTVCILTAACPARAMERHAPPTPQAPKSPTVSKVVAQPFQLQQVSTRKISDTVSQSLYKGNSTLTITPVGAASVDVPVLVELMTKTTLNAAGDGTTDGIITLALPKTRQVFAGTLTAINENFGELTGTIEARLVHSQGVPSQLRADFHGVFVKDADGAYTLVDVDAHGVLLQADRS